METKQLAPEELSKAVDFRTKKEETIWKLGEIAAAQAKLQQEQDQLKAYYLNIEAQDKSFLDSLIEKYGEGSISLETGVFTPRN